MVCMKVQWYLLEKNIIWKSLHLSNTLHDIEHNKHDIETAEDVAFVLPVVMVLADDGEGHIYHVDDNDGNHGEVEGSVLGDGV